MLLIPFLILYNAFLELHHYFGRLNVNFFLESCFHEVRSLCLEFLEALFLYSLIFFVVQQSFKHLTSWRLLKRAFCFSIDDFFSDSLYSSVDWNTRIKNSHAFHLALTYLPQSLMSSSFDRILLRWNWRQRDKRITLFSRALFFKLHCFLIIFLACKCQVSYELESFLWIWDYPFVLLFCRV